MARERVGQLLLPAGGPVWGQRGVSAGAGAGCRCVKNRACALCGVCRHAPSAHTCNPILSHFPRPSSLYIHTHTITHIPSSSASQIHTLSLTQLTGSVNSPIIFHTHTPSPPSFLLLALSSTHTHICISGSVNGLIKLGEVLSDLGQAEEGLRLLDQAVQRSNGCVSV